VPGTEERFMPVGERFRHGFRGDGLAGAQVRQGSCQAQGAVYGPRRERPLGGRRRLARRARRAPQALDGLGLDRHLHHEIESLQQERRRSGKHHAPRRRTERTLPGDEEVHTRASQSAGPIPPVPEQPMAIR